MKKGKGAKDRKEFCWSSLVNLMEVSFLGRLIAFEGRRGLRPNMLAIFVSQTHKWYPCVDNLALIPHESLQSVD